MKKRALITGISGFTGRYMQAALEEAGYEVYGSSLTALQEPNVQQVDLCDLDSTRSLVEQANPHLVVHLAAVSYIAHMNIANLYSTNILGSRNLLQALAECKAPLQSIMLASSANVYGNSTNETLTEESMPQPVNDYAISKFAMEHLCALWCDSLPVFVVRPFNYTGVGQSERFLIPKIIRQYAQHSQRIALGNLDVYREFNDVRQVAAIYTKLLQRNPVGKTINVCSGKVYSLKEIIDTMNAIAGYEIEITINAEFVRQNEIKVLRGSNSLLESLIGATEFTPITDTLRWMLKEEVCIYENRD